MNHYTREKREAEARIEAEYMAAEQGIDRALEQYPATNAALSAAGREVVYGSCLEYCDAEKEYGKLPYEQQEAVGTALAALEYYLGEY